jgi:hypothetical protein
MIVHNMTTLWQSLLTAWSDNTNVLGTKEEQKND